MEEYKCKQCKGGKVTKERKVLEVYVAKGMQNGQKIVFSGEANENPGHVAGDVVVVLKQQEHEHFDRKNSNLIYKKSISLSDALCGFQFSIKQMDGRELIVSSPLGTPLTPGEIRSIPNEGMPIWKRPDERGYMFIEFSVKFPKTIIPGQAEALQKVLGPVTPLPNLNNADTEEVQLLKFSQDHVKSSQYGSEYDDDDEEGGPRVQCAQS